MIHDLLMFGHVQSSTSHFSSVAILGRLLTGSIPIIPNSWMAGINFWQPTLMGSLQTKTPPNVDQFSTMFETPEPNASSFGCSIQTPKSVSQFTGSLAIDFTRSSNAALPNWLKTPPKSSRLLMPLVREVVKWPARCWCRKCTVISPQKKKSYHSIALIWEMGINRFGSWLAGLHILSQHTA